VACPTRGSRYSANAVIVLSSSPPFVEDQAVNDKRVRRARTFFRRERDLQEPSFDRATRKHPRELIEDNIELIDRLTRRVCRRCGVAAGEVDDALPAVTFALVEKDYTILRRYEGRSAPLR
jgi:hypothetical protein